MEFGRTTQSLIWLCILSCLMQAKAAPYSGGQGTRALPYILSCKEDILELASRPLDSDKSFLLTQDIDMEGTVFDRTIVGADVTYDSFFHTFECPFTGCFNGGGHVIANFSLIGEGIHGFFGGIGSTGRIMRLGLKNVRVDTPNYYGVGMLAGVNMGDIVGCFAQGDVAGLGNVGGLVGIQYRGRILDCFSQGTVKGVDEAAGGLMGILGGGSVERCYAAVAVISENSSGRGGLAGSPTPGTVRGGSGPVPVVLNSFWDLAVSTVSTSRGGLGLSTPEMYDVAT